MRIYYVKELIRALKSMKCEMLKSLLLLLIILVYVNIKEVSLEEALDEYDKLHNSIVSDCGANYLKLHVDDDLNNPSCTELDPVGGDFTCNGNVWTRVHRFIGVYDKTKLCAGITPETCEIYKCLLLEAANNMLTRKPESSAEKEHLNIVSENTCKFFRDILTNKSFVLDDESKECSIANITAKTLTVSSVNCKWEYSNKKDGTLEFISSCGENRGLHMGARVWAPSITATSSDETRNYMCEYVRGVIEKCRTPNDPTAYRTYVDQNKGTYMLNSSMIEEGTENEPGKCKIIMESIDRAHEWLGNAAMRRQYACVEKAGEISKRKVRLFTRTLDLTLPEEYCYCKYASLTTSSWGVICAWSTKNHGVCKFDLHDHIWQLPTHSMWKIEYRGDKGLVWSCDRVANKEGWDCVCEETSCDDPYNIWWLGSLDYPRIATRREGDVVDSALSRTRLLGKVVGGPRQANDPESWSPVSAYSTEYTRVSHAIPVHVEVSPTVMTFRLVGILILMFILACIISLLIFISLRN